MTELPKVTVGQQDDGLWVAVCDRGDFTFRHVYRHVVDDQARDHSNHAHTKGHWG